MQNGPKIMAWSDLTGSKGLEVGGLDGGATNMMFKLNMLSMLSTKVFKATQLNLEHFHTLECLNEANSRSIIKYPDFQLLA